MLSGNPKFSVLVNSEILMTSTSYISSTMTFDGNSMQIRAFSLTISYELHFPRLSNFWSMLHHVSVFKINNATFWFHILF